MIENGIEADVNTSRYFFLSLESLHLNLFY